MIVGTTLFKLEGNTYYTPQFPRGGLAATFAVETTQVFSTPTVSVQVEHKNSEDTTWSTVGSAQSITASGNTSWDVTGLKEEIRIAFDFDAGDSGGAAIHFFVQPPSFRPYA